MTSATDFDAPPPPLPDWLKRAPVHCANPVAAARALRSIIDSHSDEAERLNYVPEPVIRAVAEAGFYGLLVPNELGGSEPSPAEALDAIAELSYADGSTGWSVMASIFATAIASSNGTEELVEAMFRNGTGFTIAGQVSSLGRADRVDGGYRVKGNFKFGSGSREAAWFLGAFIEHADGKPVPNANGQPTIKLLWTPREKVRLRGNWDVMGLGATASYDFEFPEQFVPTAYVETGKRLRGGPSTQIQVGLGHAAWALGVARRALDEIRNLAQTKKRFGRTGLIDQSAFQLDYARHEAMLRASWDNCRAAFTRHYEAVAKGEDSIGVRADYRLAACWAVETSVKVGQFAYLAGGSDALRNQGGSNRLQRCFRDIHAGSQHRHTDFNTEIDCATVMLGIASPQLVL